jgi:glutaredoxin 2
LIVVKKKGQLLGPGLKSTNTQSQMQMTTNFNSADIKVLKRLYTTKELISNLIRSNKNLNDMLSNDEINTNALRNLTDSYKVDC